MPDGWVPPSDPDKPKYPYVSGFEAAISTHIPLPPFGGPRYPPATRSGVSDDYLSSVTQSQLVLSHPFRDTPAPFMPKTANLTVIKPLDIGNSWGAQVLLCSDKIHQRSVRLVIMEYIEGTSIFNVFAQTRGPHQERDAFYLDLEYRLEVLARLLNGVIRQNYAGPSQRDLAPRNVTLSPPPSATFWTNRAPISHRAT